jgi:putative ABC transport system permease protein
MKVALARKTLLHEWRRFLPVALAVGFACLLQLLQVAFVLGIFSSASVYVTGSTADLWAGYPGTQSVNIGRPIRADVEARLRMDPQVARVEPLLWLDADWQGPRGSASVFVSGISTRADAMLFARALPPAERALLDSPDAVIVDRADVDKLGVRAGDLASINGRRVRVVAVAQGLRALGGVNVLASLETARRLDPDGDGSLGPTYLVAAVKPGANPQAVAARTCCSKAFGPYEVWTASDFARRSELYWLFDTGAGAGVLFLAIVVFIAGAAISSQALMGAVAGSLREYAMLNALGVGIGALRWVVLEQAFWVSLAGLLGAIGLGGLLLLVARTQDVPVVLDPSVSIVCMVVALGVAAISGLAAVQSLQRADPATLLR